MKLTNWLDQATKSLETAAVLSARLDSELIAGHFLGQSRTWLHSHPETILEAKTVANLDSLLKHRARNEPLAYITGSKEFYGRYFTVSTNVLVPRPESEDFIELIKTLEGENLKFIDIGTGSGALSITTALEHPSWSGTATDISKEALNVAKQNFKNLKAKNLVFRVQNLLADDDANYDLVIANLPYVPNNLRNKPDIAHEPEIALFADHDGLALYEELFQQIAKRIQKPTHILTESLKTQHAQLQMLAISTGYRLKETKGLIQHFVPVS